LTDAVSWVRAIRRMRRGPVSDTGAKVSHIKYLIDALDAIRLDASNSRSPLGAPLYETPANTVIFAMRALKTNRCSNPFVLPMTVGDETLLPLADPPSFKGSSPLCHHGAAIKPPLCKFPHV
jgi:hypothetical protein